MSYNTFGKHLCVTTWGESHGDAIGCIIDGMPANIPVDVNDINDALQQRAPGKTAFTSPRKEDDKAEILSGIFNGKTTGAPISLLIKNLDVDSSKYEALKDIVRPGHIDYTYTKKYDNYDYRGGGRGSARETACRVAASVFAKALLQRSGIHCYAYLQQVGEVAVEHPHTNLDNINQSPIFCPDIDASKKMQDYILHMKEQGDSIGGIVGFLIKNVPTGLGEPVYYKLEAVLANAMLSIPASKGFEIGTGFAAANIPGSKNNDLLSNVDGNVKFLSNNSGGTLGGITNGEDIYGRVAFKAPSSIFMQQRTVDKDGNNITMEMPKGSRHDPCVAIRAVKVVEAMAYLVMADLSLFSRRSI